MNLSMQLYSARNFTPWDRVFAVIADLGYTEVEGYAAVFSDTGLIRKLLEKSGLTMPTAHMDFADLKGKTDNCIRIAGEIGIQTIYCPGIPKELFAQNEAGWITFANDLNAIQGRLAEANINFGWHNHAPEVAPVADGSVPMQVMLEHAPNLEWQVDVAWIVRGGSDPFEWFRNYGDRITAIHVKDIAPEGECQDEDGWADVGLGTMDWPALVKAVRTSTKASHFVMEHDNPSDFDRFAKRSIQNFSN